MADAEAVRAYAAAPNPDGWRRLPGEAEPEDRVVVEHELGERHLSIIIHRDLQMSLPWLPTG